MLVKWHRSAGECSRVELTENEIAIRDGWSGPPFVIAGWTGLRAGTVWSNCDPAHGIYPRDRATSGTNLHEVNYRDPDWKSASSLKAIGSSDFKASRMMG